MNETSILALWGTYSKGTAFEVTDWESHISGGRISKITIQELKLDGGCNGAIVFVVSTDSPSVSEAICKVYDDKFALPTSTHEHTVECDGKAPLNIAFEKEKEAYEKLSKKESITCRITPTYYGCGRIWVGGELQPMLLLEHVKGIPLHRIKDPQKELSPNERKNIMYKIIQADSDILFRANVRHDDLAPRNIIVETDIETDKNGNIKEKIKPYGRVCLVDFSQSKCLSKDIRMSYRNPLFTWTNRVGTWTDWGWMDGDNEGTEWMWKMWEHGSKAKGYAAVGKMYSLGWWRPKPMEEGKESLV